jgi:hypothetical protein
LHYDKNKQSRFVLAALFLHWSRKRIVVYSFTEVLVKIFATRLAVFILMTILATPSGRSQSAKIPGKGSTLFRAINCEVVNKEGKPMTVTAYRNMEIRDEVILISKTANHALIVNMRTKKAYKVPKPILGENAVNVSNQRPDHSGNVGFNVRSDKNRVRLTEIIVYFQDDSCFLCEPTVFAAIWD